MVQAAVMACSRNQVGDSKPATRYERALSPPCRLPPLCQKCGCHRAPSQYTPAGAEIQSCPLDYFRAMFSCHKAAHGSLTDTPQVTSEATAGRASADSTPTPAL